LRSARDSICHRRQRTHAFTPCAHTITTHNQRNTYLASTIRPWWVLRGEQHKLWVRLDALLRISGINVNASSAARTCVSGRNSSRLSSSNRFNACRARHTYTCCTHTHITNTSPTHPTAPSSTRRARASRRCAPTCVTTRHQVLSYKHIMHTARKHTYCAREHTLSIRQSPATSVT
jgi:hypothetical protein